MVAEHAAHVNVGVYPRFHHIPDYGAQLAPAGIDAFDPDILLVQPQIGDFGTGAEITPLTDNAIPGVVLMWKLGISHDDAVLHLHRVADVAAIPDSGIWPDVTVGADFTVLL